MMSIATVQASFIALSRALPFPRTEAAEHRTQRLRLLHRWSRRRYHQPSRPQLSQLLLFCRDGAFGLRFCLCRCLFSSCFLSRSFCGYGFASSFVSCGRFSCCLSSCLFYGGFFSSFRRCGFSRRCLSRRFFNRFCRHFGNRFFSSCLLSTSSLCSCSFRCRCFSGCFSLQRSWLLQ